MDRETLVNILKDKLPTSKMAERRLFCVAEDRLPVVCLNDIDSHVVFAHFNHTGLGPMWAQRETARMQLGVYPECTEILHRVNGDFPWLYAHVSTEDKLMVAYTPDRQAGEQDKQVKTTIGRLLSKVYPFMGDRVIADWSADHMSEVTGDFETISGTDIADFYREGAGGKLGACMSKSDDVWNYKVAPTLVYDMPNIKLAVLRNADGEVTARSLIVDVSETDKRFIRTYGARDKLEKILRRAGYKPGGWIGVELKAIVLKEREGSVDLAMPYLDQNNAMCATEHCTVAYLDGKLVGVDKRVAAALGPDAAKTASGSSAGYMTLKPSTVANFIKACPLSGVVYDSLDQTVELAHYRESPNHELVQILSSAVTSDLHYVDSARPAYYTKAPVFQHGSLTYLDTPHFRGTKGFVRLSEEYYPEDRNWYQRYDLSLLEDGEYVKPDDAETVYHIDRFVKMHKSKVQELVPVTPIDGTSKVTKDTKVHLTPSGRRVVLGLHSVSRLVDGSVDFTRNLSKERGLGRVGFVPKKALPLAVGDYWWSALAEKSLDYYTDYYGTETQALRRLLSSSASSVTIDGVYHDLHSTSQEHPDSVYEEVVKQFVEYRPEVKWIVARMRRLKAEQEALDYSVIGVQGSADNTWVAPPEVPDAYGMFAKDRCALMAIMGEQYVKYSTEVASDYYSSQGFVEAFLVAYDKRNIGRHGTPALRELLKTQLAAIYAAATNSSEN